jgi:hypothetical protein
VVRTYRASGVFRTEAEQPRFVGREVVFGSFPEEAEQSHLVRTYYEIPVIIPADAERYRAVGEGFLTALAKDPRMRNLRDRWTARRDLVRRLGSPDSKDPEVREVESAEETEAWAVLFHEFPLSWWMAKRLLFSMLNQWKAAAKAGVFPDDLVLKLQPLFSRDLVTISLEFESWPWESTKDARRRLMQEVKRQFQEAVRRAQTERRATGRRRPQKRSDSLRRWGRWFYEARVRKPRRTITELAKDLHAARRHDQSFDDCGCRREVQRGLHEAERVLTLGTPVLLNEADLGDSSPDRVT